MSSERKVVYKGFSVVSKEDEYEIVETTDSVAILIYDIQSQCFVFVRQKRPPMKRKSNAIGEILEVPAGRFDKNIPLKQLIINEVMEEVGIKIYKSQIQILNEGKPMAPCPGILTELMYLAYVEIEDLRDLEVKPGQNFGVAEEGEKTERVFFPKAAIDSLVYDDLKTFALVSFFMIDE